jgi:hypothetical protein
MACTMYKKRLRWSTYAAHVNISWRTDARRARLLFGAWRHYTEPWPKYPTQAFIQKIKSYYQITLK